VLPLWVLGAPLSAAIAVARAPSAEDCPDAERIGAQVERILGRPLAAAGTVPAALAVKVEFARLGPSYVATVRITGAREGERELRDEGPTCEGLADAVAVTTALLVDPVDRAPPPPRAPSPQRGSWLELWASGRAGGATGLVGGPTWIAGGAVEALLGPLTSIELGAAATGAHADELGAGTVQVRLWYVELGVFRSITAGDLRLGPLAQVMGGGLAGRGEGYPSSSSASLAWFAAGAGARADILLGAGVRLGARALAVVPARKQSFSIKYVGTTQESSAVGAVAEIALGVKFW
jgi:predicted outer membrane lipoprotein